MAEKVNKSCPVSCRLTGEQYAPFIQAITVSGLKPAQYFRNLVMSRLPKFAESTFDKKRMLLIFEKSGSEINRVAYQANSAPYKGAVYQSQYLRWFNRLCSILMLLQTALPTTDPPNKSRARSNGNRGSPAVSDNKDNIIRFRLTPAELNQFEYSIKRAGCSHSSFFRELILNSKPTFKEFTGFKRRIVFIANKAGNNITQLAYVAKAAGDRGIITDDVMLKWFKCLVAIEALLLAGVEHAD